MQVTSSNFGSPNGLVPTSMVWAPALGVQRMKSSMLSSRNLYTLKRRSRRFFLLRTGCPEWIRISQKHLEIWRLEQNFNALATRMYKFETGAASGSSGPGSARSWNLLGHSDGSTATGSLGSHGLGSSDDNRIARHALDTFSSLEDEHARSAVLLRFPCEQYHAEVSVWLDRVWSTANIPAFNRPIRIHCKTGPLSAGLVFETRAKCQDSVARYKEDGVSHAVDSPFCQSRTNITVRQSKSLEDREIGKQFATLWKFWLQNSKFSSLKEMAQVPSLSLHSTSVHEFSSSRIDETAWETIVQTCSGWKRTGVCSHCS